MLFMAGLMKKQKPNLIKSKLGFSALLFLRNGTKGIKNDNMCFCILDCNAYRLGGISGVLVSTFEGVKNKNRASVEQQFKRRI